MDALARATAAGVPVEFDGQTLLLDPLRLQDIGTIEQHLLKGRPNLLTQAAQAGREINRLAREEIEEIPADDPKREEKAREIKEEARAQIDSMQAKAVAEARKVNKATPEELGNFLDSPEGLGFCLWLVFNRRYPGKFTLERINEIVTDIGDEALANLMQARDQAAGVDHLGNSTGPTPSPTETGESIGEKSSTCSVEPKSGE